MKRFVAALAVFVLGVASTALSGDVSPMLAAANERLAAQGVAYRVEMAEYITTHSGPDFGRTLYASDRGNKQLAFDFVPADPRRSGWSAGSGITWISATSRLTSDVPATSTLQAIDSAMDSWESVACSTLPLVALPATGDTIGFVSALLGFGGSLDGYADVAHAGWLPSAFFDALAPNGSAFILGVTFTIVFTDDDGNVTDIDGNGKGDVAFREIYYNDRFTWRVNGGSVDIESIVLHEAGHGLSQAHFGDVFVGSNGKLQFAPRAVMNAVYVGGSQRALLGTDVGGHCSNWSAWPNN